MRNADTDADAVGIESAGELIQLAYELHTQPRGLLIRRSAGELEEVGTNDMIAE